DRVPLRRPCWRSVVAAGAVGALRAAAPMQRTAHVPARTGDDASARRRRARTSVQTRVNGPALFDAIAICGPTSSGKSEIAVRVAEAVDGEIVNADSRQVYRDMSI